MAAVVRTILTIDDTEDGFALTDLPRLRWRVETDERAWRQAGAELRIVREHAPTAQTTIEGSQAAVDWPFAAIAPRERIAVSARVMSTSGVTTAWSAPVSVVGGTLDVRGWEAEFVGSGGDDPVLLRQEFELRVPVRRATLYATAFGVTRVRVNGVRVGDRELAPGWTSYQWRVDYDIADVTGLLRSGRNAIGVELAGGWYTEAYGFRDAARRFYEGPPAASAFVVVEHEDGTVSRWGTDDAWRFSRGAARSASLYQGETHDERLAPSGWAEPGFDDVSWEHVVVGRAYTDVVPAPRVSPPVRVTEDVAPISIGTSPSGATIVDFGQNLVGRVRIRLDAQAGTRIRLRHAEVLEGGELSRRPLRNAAAEDVYIARGGGEEWEPSWTFHGFRYVEVDGWPGSLEKSAITARVLGTDLRRTGGFRTSHRLVQRLHDNVVWGARGNFLSVPTDCPQRDERLGWTGDTQVFAPTAAFLFDSERFLRSWMTDVITEQGAVGGIVPMVVPAVIPQVPGLFEPIAAWGDVITILPAALGLATGDDTLTRISYSGMRRWIEVILARAGDAGLWEDGRQFGDWLDPDAPPDLPGRAKTDPDIVATAYLYRSTTLAARAATALGHEEDAAEFAELAERVRRAFHDAYVTAAGRIVVPIPPLRTLSLSCSASHTTRNANGWATDCATSCVAVVTTSTRASPAPRSCSTH